MDNIDEVANTISHDQLLEITQSSLCTLLNCDSLLSDLPPDIITEEILSQIAVEHGQSITIFIFREDEPALKVIVPQKANVGELKKAVARHFELNQKRTGSTVKISWKYIWKTYHLRFDAIILDHNKTPIEDYGVTNKVTLHFTKRRKKARNKE